jgi:hypothetical protein
MDQRVRGHFTLYFLIHTPCLKLLYKLMVVKRVRIEKQRCYVATSTCLELEGGPLYPQKAPM